MDWLLVHGYGKASKTASAYHPGLFRSLICGSRKDPTCTADRFLVLMNVSEFFSASLCPCFVAFKTYRFTTNDQPHIFRDNKSIRPKGKEISKRKLFFFV